MNKTIRIAFLINDKFELPAWEADMLASLQKEGNIQVDTLLAGQSATVPEKSFIYRLFEKFEDRWFGSHTDAFKKINCKKIFPDFKLIDISETKKITDLGLDLIYCSCLSDKKKVPVYLAEYGIWRVLFGINKYTGKMPRAFQEVMDDCPEIGSALIVQHPDMQSEIIVYKGTTTSVPYSVKNSLNCIAWKSSSFLLHRLRELSQNGPGHFFNFYKNKYEAGQLTDIHKYPSSILMIKYWAVNMFRYIFYKIRLKFFAGKFTIFYSFQKFGLTTTDYKKFKPLKPPPGTFWADVFLAEQDGSYFLFFEEFINKTRKAHISVLEVKKDGTVSAPVTVLSKPYHVSYPFIFQCRGAYYMVPETSRNNSVELYKCRTFPYEWVFEMTLLNNMPLMDATLVQHDGKWWMFGCLPQNSFTSTNDQLFLYYSDSFLSSDWTPHPQNPVVTIISNCRPAGNIFESNGKLYRPAQNNSSKQYGYAIKINEIEILNETEYKEKEVFEILPDKKNKLAAIHTLNFINNLIVIDGIRK